MDPLFRVQSGSLADAPGDAEGGGRLSQHTLGEGTCRHRHRGDGSGAAGKFPESVPQGLMRLGLSPGAQGLCLPVQRERNTSRRGVQAMVLTASWFPQWGWAAPGLLFSPSLCQRRAAMQMGSTQGPPSPSLSPAAGAQLTAQTHGVEGSSLLGGPGGSPCRDHTHSCSGDSSARVDTLLSTPRSSAPPPAQLLN